MDEQLIGLRLCLEEAGRFDMKNAGDRLRVQKVVYLMQLFGVDLGYRFSWYLRGPYCTALSEDLFEAEVRTGEEDLGGFRLRPGVREALCRFRQFLEKDPPDGLTEEAWLELVASVHYLKHIAYRPSSAAGDFGAICERLRKMRPEFSAEQIRAAWEVLGKYGLIENLKCSC